jgi:hypothetical protein
VEEMIGQLQSGGMLVWRELLSSSEIKAWLENRKTPDRLLRGELAYPGVYRFVFQERVDGSARHTPSYVGEGGDVGRRLKGHFAPPDVKEVRDSNGVLKLKSGWQVRGSVQNSNGKFSLEILTVEGFFDLNGVMLNEHSFDCPFARKLLENWAILSSERTDKLRLLNRGVRQSNKHLISEIQAVIRQRMKDY